MKLINTTLRWLIVFRDGCAVNISLNFVFILLLGYNPGVIFECSNEVPLGKGLMDGENGMVKNVLLRKIKVGKVTINTSFAELLINMFLQLSKCFSKPMVYWRNKTILIICHPSLMINEKTQWQWCTNT